MPNESLNLNTYSFEPVCMNGRSNMKIKATSSNSSQEKKEGEDEQQKEAAFAIRGHVENSEHTPRQSPPSKSIFRRDSEERERESNRGKKKPEPVIDPPHATAPPCIIHGSQQMVQQAMNVVCSAVSSVDAHRCCRAG